MTNILLYGGNAGLSHAMYTVNYAIALAEKIIEKSNSPVNIYNSWECIKHFNDIFDVNYSNYKKDSFDLSELYKFKSMEDIAKGLNLSAKDILKLDTLPQEKNIILNSCCTAELPDTLSFFNIYKLKKNVLEKLKTYYSNLDNGNYIGIHFRGSDILENKKIKHEDFLHNASKKIENILNAYDCKILLASDNQKIIAKYVDNRRVFSYSLVYAAMQKNILIEDTQRLHCCGLSIKTPITEYEILESAAIDKFLLAHSKHLYADLISGYGQHANQLFVTLQKNPKLKVLY